MRATLNHCNLCCMSNTKKHVLCKYSGIWTLSVTYQSLVRDKRYTYFNLFLYTSLDPFLSIHDRIRSFLEALRWEEDYTDRYWLNRNKNCQAKAPPIAFNFKSPLSLMTTRKHDNLNIIVNIKCLSCFPAWLVTTWSIKHDGYVTNACDTRSIDLHHGMSGHDVQVCSKCHDLNFQNCILINVYL